MNETLNPFEQAIKDYLDGFAEKDPTFAEKYKAKGKSIKECCNYIIGWVKAQKREGFSDSEIFGQAVHYYDEKDIKIASAGKCKVVVNHTIELSETQKKEAEKAAREQYERQELEKLKAAREKKATKAKADGKDTMQDLFAGML